MDRRLRASQPAALPLEGRILLARVHVPIVPPATESSAASLGSVWFKGAAQDAEALAAQNLSLSFVGTTQAVVQQGDEATVWLGARLPTAHQWTARCRFRWRPTRHRRPWV